MELVTYSEGDLALTVATDCDPEMMRELGGPLPRSEAPALHRRRLDGITKGDWWFKIVPDPPGPVAGTIGIWQSNMDGKDLHEIGWMVLPDFQGRGVATEALALLLTRARSEPRFSRIHAFPGVSNAASNALCRRFGFSMVEEREFEFRGSVLRCNHWLLDVSE
jgi:RimJ/RimL family protein N-acetyltransferase